MPALLGIPALITFISSILMALITWIIERIGKRILVYGLGMAAILTALTLLYSSFSDYISQLALSMPPEFQTAAMLLPSNTDTCIGIILSAELTALSYRFAVYIARTKMDLVS